MTWQIGDTIPLTLYVPNGDNSTGTSVTYSATDAAGNVLASGTVSPAPSTTDVGKTWNAEKVATVGGTWTFRWTVTGTGAGTELFVAYVSDTPPVPWVPSLREVADYVPSRTVPIDTAADDPKMTFDTTTRPNGESVARLIKAAVGWVTATCGTIDSSLYDTAQSVAAIRAAALVEMSYPERDGDTNVSNILLLQADNALKALEKRNEILTDTSNDPTANLLPDWSFPDPTLEEDVRPQRTSAWGGASSHSNWGW